MTIKKALIIIGQIIIVFLFLLSGSLLIHMNIPENGAICDPEQILLFETWMIFIILGIGLLFNSWIFYSKGKWKKYRVIIISTTLIFFFLSIFLRQIIMVIEFGKETKVIEGNELVYIKVKLYDNGKFFAYTYDISCESENVGTYKLTDNKLFLKFKSEKPEYLGTEYQIENEMIECLDCKKRYELKIK